MRRVASATVQPAMAARHDLAIITPTTSSVAASLLAGAILRASVVVSFVSITISGLLLITRPAVNLVEDVAGLAKLDTDTTWEGQEER